MYLYSFLFAHFLELFTCIGYVGYYYCGLVFGFVCWVAVAGCVGGVVVLLLGLGELVVPLVEGQRGELTMFESCFDVVQFLVPCWPGMKEQFWPYVPGC